MRSMATESEPRVPRMKLGALRLEVSAQGLGCLGISAFYGPPKPEPEMTEIIRHAIRSGVTPLDTSDLYGSFTNEILIGKALRGGMREKGDPAYVRASCEASLKRLDVKSIDLYYQHRISFPHRYTFAYRNHGRELMKLVEEGKIKYIGLCEASASTTQRAHAVHPITAVQLWAREAEKEIIPTCRELGIGMACGPLGRGFFTSSAQLVQNLADARKTLPRFQPQNLEHNKNLFERVKDMAARKGCTPSQLALAWVYHKGNNVCPIPGATKIANLEQNIGALAVKLTPEDLVEEAVLSNFM